MSWAEIKKAIEWSSPGNVGGFKMFTSSGTFTVPNNVYQLTVSGYGASGGGGGGGFPSDSSASGSYYGGAGGGGGAGGFIVDGVINVTPGDVLTITTGAGGAEGLYDGHTNGEAGGDTIIAKSGTPILTLGGGSGGIGSQNKWGASGGAGGTVSGDFTSGRVGNGNGGGSGGNGGNSSSSSGTGAMLSAISQYAIVYSGTHRTQPNFLFDTSQNQQGGSGGYGGSRVNGTFRDGGNGTAGKPGYLLVCWGGVKYTDVALIMNWMVI